jgi:hypothetical protein
LVLGVGAGHGCRVLVLVPGLMYELFELHIYASVN